MREVELALRPLSQKTKVFCPLSRIRSTPLICLRLARHTPRMLAHRSRPDPMLADYVSSTPAYPYIFTVTNTIPILQRLTA
jgi:hypothetical protein